VAACLLGGVNTLVIVFAIEFVLRFWSEGDNPAPRGVIGRLKFLATP
jgi:hypothetical protein